MTKGPHRVTKPLLAVLKVLSEHDELHGWEIMRQTRKSGPTVYKILERMEGWSWVTPRWGPLEKGRPRRRYYRLTELGRVAANSLLEARQ